MAQKDIIFNMKINGVDREIKTMGDLKKATKDVKSELLSMEAGTKEFADANKRLNELQEKMGDVGDAAKITGNGMERLQASFGLFAEGVQNFDGDKMKLALQGIGGAMKAIPLLFLLEGVRLLIENFDKIADFIFPKATKESERLTKQLEAQKKVNEGLYASMESQIRIMEAEGKSIHEIIKAKKELNERKIEDAKNDLELQKTKIREIFLNDSITESIQRNAAAVQRKLGNDKLADMIEQSIHIDKMNRAKELADAIRQDFITIQKLTTDNTILTIEENKKVTDDGKKANQERLDNWKELDKQLSDAKIAGAQVDKENRKMIADDVKKEQEDEKDAKLDAIQEIADAEYAALLKKQDDEKKASDKAKELARAEQEAKMKMQDNYFAATKALSDTFFSLQLENAKGNAAKELELKKKQFQVEKAFSVTRAVIDGIRSVQGALAQTATLGPLAVGLAISNGVLSAANVAKILAQQFNPGSSGGGGGSSSGGGGSFNLPTPPTQAPSTQPSTRFDEQGNNLNNPGTVKAYVVETEISGSQGRVNRLQDQATFG